MLRSRILAFVVTSAVMLTGPVAFSTPASANGNCVTFFNGRGTGTPASPYLVSSQLDLEEVAFCLGASFLQTADVSLSGVWTSLGSTGARFSGTYDGGGFGISDLTISASGVDDVGLFGFTEGALLTRINIRSGTITGQDNVGGLAGNALNSSITSSSSAAAVSGRHKVGGLAGNMVWTSGSRQDLGTSFATGNVTSSGNYSGGLVGEARFLNISDVYATGSVTGDWQVGGLIGENDHSTLTHVYAAGLVTDSIASNAVGGVMGQQTAGTYAGVTWDINTTGQNYSDFAATVTTGSTTAQMKDTSTFTNFGWNISSTWNESGAATWLQCPATNSGYPFLSAFFTLATSGCPAQGNADLTIWHLSIGRDFNDSACPTGYSPSWAQWPHGRSGGWVCNREVFAYRPLLAS